MGANVVAVFYAPIQRQWVIRRFVAGLRFGDVLVDVEPSDAYLARHYPGYRVTRGWMVQ